MDLLKFLCSATIVCNHYQSSESTFNCSAEDKTGKKREHAWFTKIMATKSSYVLFHKNIASKFMDSYKNPWICLHIRIQKVIS